MEQNHIMVNKHYQLGLYEKSMPSSLSWEEKLTYCKEFGFDFLEMSVDETDEKLSRLDWMDKEVDELRQLMVKTGVPIRTMCLSGHRKYPLGSLDEEVRNKSLTIMKKAIHLAGQLGIRIIQLAGYDVYYQQSNAETKKYFMENLKIASQYASKMGVYLGFETMETPFMDTVEKAMDIIKDIHSPYLNVYPDVGNLTNASHVYGHDVLGDIKKGWGHLVAAHLKETKPSIYRDLSFGQGHVQFLPILETLKEMDVSMFVAEFWYNGQDNWQAECRAANSFLSEKLDDVYK